MPGKASACSRHRHNVAGNPRSCAGVTVTHDLEEACKDVDVAVLLSGVALRPGCSAAENVQRSVSLYRQLGAALQAQASRDVKARAGCRHSVCISDASMPAHSQHPQHFSRPCKHEARACMHACSCAFTALWSS